MSNRRATMKDVAELAGVGKVTVSYVLNGQSRHARISDETAQKVLVAAESLNYRPHALARMLVTKRTDLLAVVFQRGYFFTSWSSFTAEVMRGVATAAVELGYDLMLHTKDVPRESEADVLADGRVDGALILRDEDDPITAGLAERSLPCVRFFSRSQSGPFVDADNVSGGRLATRHLIELGHRRIAMIRGPLRSTASNDRFEGYCASLQEAGITVDENLVLTVPYATAGVDQLSSLMQSANPPTALFVWSDDIAFQCLGELRKLGLRVPEDVSIVGFDSLPACERSVPPLTSVRQPVFEMAQEATHLLVSLIRKQEPAQRQVLYPLSLDVRGSTAPCTLSLTR